MDKVVERIGLVRRGGLGVRHQLGVLLHRCALRALTPTEAKPMQEVLVTLAQCANTGVSKEDDRDAVPSLEGQGPVLLVAIEDHGLSTSDGGSATRGGLEVTTAELAQDEHR